MKKIFSALALLSTIFVSAHEGKALSTEESKKIIVEEQHLTCNCPGHDVNTAEEEKEVVVAEDALLACGSSSCSHDKDNK